MNEFVQVEFTSLQQGQSDVLIALLSGIGYTGFQEEENFLRAYIPVSEFDDSQLTSLAKDQDVEFSVITIPEKNWNEEWESTFEPVFIDEFVAIRAAFHKPVEGVEHDIVITPKMSFGTGHHETTVLVMEAMRKLDLRGKTVLDFGTGTGILAILAEKLGAKKIIAIDNDSWSILNAEENVHQNNCELIEIIQASEPVNQSNYDIILCNILKSVILGNFSKLVDQLNANGYLIFSGLMQQDQKEIEEMVDKYGLKILEKTAKGNWICLTITS